MTPPGPVIGSYIGVTGVLSWRWSEWIILIIDGLVIMIVFCLMSETLAPRLLLYKASHLRHLTGDKRFLTAQEAEGRSFVNVLKLNFTRPFMLALEPIVFLFTLYLSVVYIILFTFLDGYPFIFDQVYGIGQGLANLCFIGLLVGILLSMVTVPFVYHITKKQLARDGDDGTGKAINQETRLIFAMIGAPLIPIGLFWMGWTDYVSDPNLLMQLQLTVSVALDFDMVATYRVGGYRLRHHMHFPVGVHVCHRQLSGLRCFGVDLRGIGQICGSWWNVSLHHIVNSIRAHC